VKRLLYSSVGFFLLLAACGGGDPGSCIGWCEKAWMCFEHWEEGQNVSTCTKDCESGILWGSLHDSCLSCSSEGVCEPFRKCVSGACP